jgi:hypothetical protein
MSKIFRIISYYYFYFLIEELFFQKNGCIEIRFRVKFITYVLYCVLGDPGVDGKIILRWIFGKWDVRVWTGSSWIRIGTSGGHLWLRKWTFGFHKTGGISWLAENMLASQKGLCCMEIVSKYALCRVRLHSIFFLCLFNDFKTKHAWRCMKSQYVWFKFTFLEQIR